MTLPALAKSAAASRALRRPGSFQYKRFRNRSQKIATRPRAFKYARRLFSYYVPCMDDRRLRWPRNGTSSDKSRDETAEKPASKLTIREKWRPLSPAIEAEKKPDDPALPEVNLEEEAAAPPIPRGKRTRRAGADPSRQRRHTMSITVTDEEERRYRKFAAERDVTFSEWARETLNKSMRQIQSYERTRRG